MNENQYLKMLKNVTSEALEKLDETYEKNTYEYVLRNGFPDEGKHALFNGINGNHFCPCGSGQKYKACCIQLVERLVGCLEACTYAGSIETTKNKAKLPLSFKLSPVFQIEAELSEKETKLVKEIIRTHPTIVNRLYLISAKEIAQAYAESEHARYLLNLIYDLEEEAKANWEDFKNDKRQLNEREKQHFIENKITVPTHAESMRSKEIEWLASDRFVLV